MDKIKEILTLIFGSRLLVEGNGRTFAKAPLWLVVFAGLFSIRLVILTALLIVAFGMKPSIVKA